MPENQTHCGVDARALWERCGKCAKEFKIYDNYAF